MKARAWQEGILCKYLGEDLSRSSNLRSDTVLTLARTQRLRLTFTGRFLIGLRFSKKRRFYELLKITLAGAEKNISTPDPSVFSFFLSVCPLLFYLPSPPAWDSLN